MFPALKTFELNPDKFLHRSNQEEATTEEEAAALVYSELGGIIIKERGSHTHTQTRTRLWPDFSGNSNRTTRKT